ncbi:major facilitator superfamily MFS_1 [Xylanimonas cellulosilytica DSM 15894]|uniref:Major facilitator superfamily MFS_1 n=1 Tax=Xylanimonas cellulosilytica (strain DSM 15894 / JCM 12276 / CECT 5975 / KCTC 9989 / LMG 20990 / NBRC 107835 / XIL07) TaxID=446471 RepID=D1BY61_XYLCX|nr:MFS transporter [Xylanimonas cellulosilytica]ACZ29904.1 major facilitator superfamily MFS_1 [Xylanimonas cellulosilytica DSM 15894]
MPLDPTQPSPPSPPGDARPRATDRFTWSMFATFSLWGWVLYMFGPATQLLGSERGLSDTLTGLHGTAMAVGTVLAGTMMPRLVPALGRRRTLMVSAVLIAAGLTVFVASPAFVLGLAAVVVMSIGGGMTLGAGAAGLVLHHGPRAAAAALTTGNGLGTVAGVVGPLALGAAVGFGLGWRAALLTTVPLAAAAYVLWSRTVPAERPRLGSGHDDDGGRARLVIGRDAWLLLLATVSGTAIEFATTFWAASLLRESTGATAGVAAGSTAGLVAGMALSRLASGPATRRWGAPRLVATAFGVAGIGWAVLWTATTPVVAIVGLVIAGLGTGLLFPMGSALFLAAARGPVDSAQSVVTVAAGTAIGVVPFALGAFADLVGVHTAFLVVPVFVVVGLAGVLVGSRPWHAH